MPPSALIVAHGQPSDPLPAEADLARLGQAVQALLPGWQVATATLAAPGALQRALAEAGAPLVFPFFMAEGWFTRTELPRRLAAAGHGGLSLLPAFGTLAAVSDLAATAARIATLGRGWRIEETVLILAAHGSGQSRAPAKTAGAIQTALATALPFRAVRLGFIEEEPALQVAATGAGPKALCLPLFVARWGHVIADIPAALAAAGFRGPCLAPLGMRPEVPAIIAAAFRSGQSAS